MNFNEETLNHVKSSTVAIGLAKPGETVPNKIYGSGKHFISSPFLGIIMIYVLHKGGQVSNMQNSLKEIKRIEEENQRLRLDQMKKDALEKRDRDNRNVEIRKICLKR